MKKLQKQLKSSFCAKLYHRSIVKVDGSIFYENLHRSTLTKETWPSFGMCHTSLTSTRYYSGMKNRIIKALCKT